MTSQSIVCDSVVLRALRYGEADRILHVYTAEHGRLSVMAKGVRRTRSRFGGRLEPLTRVELVLHRGRGDLHTARGAQTLAAHPRLLTSGAAIDVASRSCDAVARLFADGEPHPPVYHLLCNQLALLDADPAMHATRSNALAFRLKLLLAAGFSPQLGACVECGAREDLVGFSGGAGGVVCTACQAGAFPLAEEAHEFLVAALGRPLAEAPPAGDRALAQAERAIAETLEHHGGVRLRAVRRG
jgi:DNA repair protein RecO (recombination protein O)